jgi:hypothetical protein
MDPRTMRNLVKEDLGMESCVIVQRLLQTPKAQEMRKERCRKLLNKLKACQCYQVRIFSDEKIFTCDLAINHHNSPYLMDFLRSMWIPASAYLPSPGLPLKQMVLGVVFSDGQKCLIIFVGVGE